MRFENFKRVLMSAVDEGGASAAPESGTTEPADSGANDANPDDEQIVLTRSQFEAAMNSQAARVRKAYERKQPPTVDEVAAKVAQDPRIARGLELLAKVEKGEAFREKVALALNKGKPATTPQPAAAAQPTSELGELVTLMKLQLQQQMIDRMPKPPVQYASQGDQVRGEINAAIADIPEDDPKRHEKVQAAVMNKLRGVRVATGAHSPNSALMPTKK